MSLNVSWEYKKVGWYATKVQETFQKQFHIMHANQVETESNSHLECGVVFLSI